MKNRKREICTSGTVRDEAGNILIYSANDRGGLRKRRHHSKPDPRLDPTRLPLDPDGPDSSIRFLPRVFGGEALIGQG